MLMLRVAALTMLAVASCSPSQPVSGNQRLELSFDFVTKNSALVGAGLVTKSAFEGLDRPLAYDRLTVNYTTSTTDRLGNEVKQPLYTLYYKGADINGAKLDNLTNIKVLNLAYDGAFDSVAGAASVSSLCQVASYSSENVCKVLMKNLDA